MKKRYIVIISVLVILVLISGIIYFKSEKRGKEGFVVEDEKGNKKVIDGIRDMDERFIDSNTGSIDIEKMRRYIEGEIELTKRAIENYKNDPEKERKYINRLRRLTEISNKIK